MRQPSLSLPNESNCAKWVCVMVLRQQLAIWLQGETLHGNIWQAGLPRTLLDNPSEAGVS